MTQNRTRALAAVMVGLPMLAADVPRKGPPPPHSVQESVYVLTDFAPGSWRLEERLGERVIGYVEGDFTPGSVDLLVELLAATGAPNPAGQCRDSVVAGCCGSAVWPPCAAFCWYAFGYYQGGGVSFCLGACVDSWGNCPPPPAANPPPTGS